MMILPLFIALIMLKFSWQKWPELLIDFGRELYVPWQLSCGSVLYKDIAYFNGPLSQYVNSFLFKVFGAGLMTLAIFNIVVIFILMYIIYRFYALVSNKTTAALTASVFLTVAISAGKNYNFVCPYSHEMTHGVFLSLLSIYLFLIYLRRRSDIVLVIIGILTGLVFLTKIEFFLAEFTALICGFSLFCFIHKVRKKEALKLFAIFFLGFFLPIVVFVIFLSRHLAPFEALVSLVVSYKAVFATRAASNALYLAMAGFDRPGINIINMLLAASGYLFVIFCIRATGRALERLDKMRASIFRGLALFIISLLFALAVSGLNIYIPDSEIFRGLPLAMLASIIYYYNKRRDNLALLVMSIFSFILLFKIVLNVRAVHYGFALALPAALLLTKLFVCELAREVYLKALALSFVAITLFFNISYAKERYDRARFSVGSGKDVIITIDSPTLDAKCVRRALSKIEALVGKDETFIVLPEGVMLNYLTRRRNPSPHVNFMPLELEIFGEDAILDSFVRSKPDYIILIERRTGEYGFAYFGRDYGRKIFKWVKENYIPIALIGEEPLENKGFGIVICKESKI